MPIRVSCPYCEAVLKAPDTAAGKTVKCPKCQNAMSIPQSPPEPPPLEASIPIILEDEEKPLKRHVAIDEDDERPWKRRENSEDREIPKPRKKKKQQNHSTIVLVLGVFLVVIVSVAKVVRFFRVVDKVEELVERNTDEAKPAKPNLGNVPPNVAPQMPAIVPRLGNGIAIPNPPRRSGTIPVVAAPSEMTVGVYGVIPGGEQAIDPAEALIGTPRRPSITTALYQLSNPRFQPKKNQNSSSVILEVDVARMSQGGERSHPMARIRTPGGIPSVVMGFGAILPDSTSRTTMEIQITPFGPNRSVADLEIFLTAIDHKLPSKPEYKVSNSLTLGRMPDTYCARNWTVAEVEEYLKGPPAYERPDAPTELGKNTQFVGIITQNINRGERYLDPEAALIGVEFQKSLGNSENARITMLKPIFSRDQPERKEYERQVAPEGYAIGGAEVSVTKQGLEQLVGLRFIYHLQKPDGSLDPKQTLNGEWIGTPSKKSSTQGIGSRGKKVIGLEMRGIYYIDSLCLVTE